jgi:hypothetical protein
MSETTTKRHGSEKRQRTALHMVRLTPAEKIALSERAKAAGMDVAAYVRHQALGAAGPRVVRRLTADMAELARLRGALGYVGNNLNQLTRLANMGDMDRPQDLDEVLSRVMSMLDEVRAAMGRP